MDCIFCKIVNGIIPSKEIYSDEVCYAFADINPQAPVHCLIVPRIHLDSLDEVNLENKDTVAHILAVIPTIAKKLGLENGYRVITNIGKDGAQSVKHLHFHLLGGKTLSENMA